MRTRTKIHRGSCFSTSHTKIYRGSRKRRISRQGYESTRRSTGVLPHGILFMFVFVYITAAGLTTQACFRAAFLNFFCLVTGGWCAVLQSTCSWAFILSGGWSVGITLTRGNGGTLGQTWIPRPHRRCTNFLVLFHSATMRARTRVRGWKLEVGEGGGGGGGGGGDRPTQTPSSKKRGAA